AQMNRRTFPILAAVLTVVGVAPEPGVLAREAPTAFANGVVVSVCPEASAAGLSVLKAGGNAVDSAVATAFALAVTYPAAGNIGGGGFMLVYPGGKAEPVVIDYREVAPHAATSTMFSKTDGLYNHKVVGVPGTVRGLALAHQRF